MKTINLKKNILCLFVLCYLNVTGQNQTPIEPRFKTFYEGTAFTTITVDKDKNVWAGTNRLGLFYKPSGSSSFSSLTLGTSPFVLSTLNIQTLAADQSGTIWVGHNGTGSLSGQFGGIERITGGVSTHLAASNDDCYSRGPRMNVNDGYATRNSKALTVDKNNTVWSAQGFTLVNTLGGGSGDFIITCGTLSYKKATDAIFTSKSTYSQNNTFPTNPDLNFPYPPFTCDPVNTSGRATRNCRAISSDKTGIWMAVDRYDNAGNQVIEYDLNGIFKNRYLRDQMKFTQSINLGTINGVYRNNSRGSWVTTNVVGNGFSIMKTDKKGNNPIWFNIKDPTIMPSDTKFNDNAIWGDALGRVYMGTNNGLIVYDGAGPVDSLDSYKLYSKLDYLSTRCVYDPNMLSNNITGGATEGKLSPYFSWITTANGIMRSYLPGGDILSYHVDNKDAPYRETSNGKENYRAFAELFKVTTSEPSEEKIPCISVDGTTSTVFRYKTSVPRDFYENDSFFKIKIKDNNYSEGEGTPGSESYIARYGHFDLKPPSYYENGLTLDNLEHIDIIYKHPEYINETDFVSGKHYANFRLIIEDRRDPNNIVTVFDHPIKFCLPPVLIGHGVWADINSVQKIEDFLKTKGFTDSELLKNWRKDKKLAENEFEVDADIIPSNIEELRFQALNKKVSAGKVNIIVHSRGGLYTRAYVEGISPRTSYKKDINSLITLNTPHSGSQAANAILDKRILIPSYIKFSFNPLIPFVPIITSTTPKSISDLLLTLPVPVPRADQLNNWGAKNLLVEIDSIKPSNNDITTDFIKKLNLRSNLNTFKDAEIPIHAIATNFSLCQIRPILCSNVSFADINKTSKADFSLLLLAEAVQTSLLPSNVAQGFDGFMKHLLGGETNDLIVPKSSMEAGLDSRFVSNIVGQNIGHIADVDILGNSSGVTTNPEVQNRIFELLKQNFKSSTTNFTIGGFNPPELTYNFLPNLNFGYINRNNNDTNDKSLVINPTSLTGTINPGNVITFDVIQQNLDKIIISYDYSGSDNVYIFKKVGNLTTTNTFTFTIPQEFIGKFKITAYGFSGGQMIGESSYEPIVQIPPTITLQSIRFDYSNIRIQELDNYQFELLGTYSDGVERRINELSGIAYTLGNATILQRIDDKTIKGTIPGETTFKIAIGILNTTLNVFVEENPVIKQSLITNFYTNYQNNNPVTIKWDTNQEYRSKKFILESSTDNVNFTQINEQLGSGTNYTPASYNFIDNTTESIIYYRLRLLNLDDAEVYNQTIQVNRSTLSINDAKFNSNKLVLSPNPLTENTGTLSVYSTLNDDNASLNIYTIS
ncbi:hypothetical protein, partial [Flavobacterium sp.]|uniref:hypothetical protein n=1 Tax=Flavobacterium sp. TaxID=239 RepID=UPI00286E81D2